MIPRAILVPLMPSLSSAASSSSIASAFVTPIATCASIRKYVSLIAFLLTFVEICGELVSNDYLPDPCHAVLARHLSMAGAS
jgi:hypothetical protein